MVNNPLKVVLDTNVFISAFIFSGKPRDILKLVIDRKIKGFISPLILSELTEVLIKKFNFEIEKIKFLEKLINNNFKLIYPLESVDICKDRPDNCILEAALAGNCDYIITGDQHLLSLKIFQGIKIITVAQFLEVIYKP